MDIGTKMSESEKFLKTLFRLRILNFDEFMDLAGLYEPEMGLVFTADIDSKNGGRR